MHRSYEDITSRLGEPIWWDPMGCPRYNEPSIEGASVYAVSLAILRIQCQKCHKPFVVSLERKPVLKRSYTRPPVINRYGDPPNHDCSGDTMTSDFIELLAYWERVNLDWKEIPVSEFSCE